MIKPVTSLLSAAASRLTGLALAITLLFAGASLADNSPINFIGPSVADSTCIGETSTYECDVDTWFACLHRKDSRLCGLLGLKDISFNPRHEPGTRQYLIIDALVYSSDFSNANPRDVPIFEFDYLKVRVLERACVSAHSGMTCDKSFSKAVYYLERPSDGFRLVGWSHEADATCGYHDDREESFAGECELFVSPRSKFRSWPY